MVVTTLEPRATERQRQSTLLPFTIEAYGPQNNDLLIQSLAGKRLRSNIRPVKTISVRDPRTGEMVKRPAPANLIPGLPAEVPGQMLDVDPGKGTYRIYDPLCGDEDMLDTLQRALSESRLVMSDGKLRGVAETKGRLERDHMKNLVREMSRLVTTDYARVVKGMMPSMEEIDAMPGDYLTNARGTTDWRTPRYEKDVEEWERSLNRVG